MGSVYALANQKGGVGKTTTAVNLGACAAAEGRQVLLVDLDPQCNATVALGLSRDEHPSTYDCLAGDESVAVAARPAGPDNLWIVPANRDLAGASVELPRIDGYERRLGDGLGPHLLEGRGGRAAVGGCGGAWVGIGHASPRRRCGSCGQELRRSQTGANGRRVGREHPRSRGPGP